MNRKHPDSRKRFVLAAAVAAVILVIGTACLLVQHGRRLREQEQQEETQWWHPLQEQWAPLMESYGEYTFQGRVTEAENRCIVIGAEGDGEEKWILISDYTVLRNEQWEKLSVSDLEAGQKIEVRAGEEVFYDPVTTYFCCYEVVVLE